MIKQRIKYLLFIFVFIAFILLSCSHHQYVKAKIFERKHISNDRLLIKYKYSVESKIFIDSAFVANNVIDNDTINVSIDTENPSDSKSELSQ